MNALPIVLADANDNGQLDRVEFNSPAWFDRRVDSFKVVCGDADAKRP